LLLNPTKASVNEGLKQTASQQVGQKWGRSKQQKSVDKNQWHQVWQTSAEEQKRAFWPT
jgi:hypothetical protein